MNKLTKYILIVLTVATSNTAWADEQKFMDYYKTQHNKKNQISLLFLQQANKVSLIPAHDNCYNITLSGLDNYLLYFSNEPAHIVGKASMEEFVNVWQHDKIQPNVAIHGNLTSNKNSKTANEILIFSAPHYNAKQHRLTYTACVTQKNNVAPVKKTLYNATLFYDNFIPFDGM